MNYNVSLQLAYTPFSSPTNRSVIVFLAPFPSAIVALFVINLWPFAGARPGPLHPHDSRLKETKPIHPYRKSRSPSVDTHSRDAVTGRVLLHCCRLLPTGLTLFNYLLSSQ